MLHINGRIYMGYIEVNMSLIKNPLFDLGGILRDMRDQKQITFTEYMQKIIDSRQEQVSCPHPTVESPTNE
jgi:hypothetical protein